MKATVANAASADVVLGRMLAAAWPALPAIAATGIISTSAGFAAGWLLGPQSPWLPLVVGLVAAPAIMWAVDSMHGAVFDVRPPRLWDARRLLRIEVPVLLVAGTASWSMLSAYAAAAAGSLFFQILAVAGVVACAFALAVATVALPLAALRDDVRLRTVLRFAVYAMLRRPLGAIAAILCSGAVVWLGLTWFSGLLFLALPVCIVLAVAAAWPTIVVAGVTMPRLLPAARRRRPHHEGEQ